MPLYPNAHGLRALHGSAPTAADHEAARVLVDEMSETRCPVYMANNREHLLGLAARQAMHVRRQREYRVCLAVASLARELRGVHETARRIGMRGDSSGVARSSAGRSAPLRAEPPSGVSGLRRAAANARSK